MANMLLNSKIISAVRPILWGLFASLMLSGTLLAESDYERDVLPVLQSKCYACHGPDKQESGYRLDVREVALRGGDSGEAAIVASRPEDSQLWQRIASDDDDVRMPPPDSDIAELSSEQQEVLRSWIAGGAEWPDALAGQSSKSTHWALQPIQRPELPASGTHPIDEFIRSRLRTAGIAPAAAADRRTLIRRLTFDLIGLPPTPQETNEFIHDPDPLAYERLVDRLLESPYYGERWARHWLDVARYTESQGYEYDRVRDNAWHYRDYVIKSFNDDKPYDQFMMEQIAGDVMEPVTRERIIGASLLVCGPWDQAGNGQANAVQRTLTREEELEDMISVVGQGFLGLTVNCARCHSHKFDPIPQLEYYRIKSVFEGVKHGERALPSAADPATTDEVSYVGTRVQPEPTRLFLRGDVKSPQQVVTPGALSAITGLAADFQLPADAPESERRLKFAQWLADPRNPLPARVLANRLWHWHFGRGLVATPSDFGVNGEAPTHPELLDFLASELIAQHWSVKSLHRLIVTSTTYKQDGTFREAAALIDGDNRLLWRYAPRRLEAEAIRDAMLAVSGRLNSTAGGPSFRNFTTTEFNATFYHPIDKETPEFNRRTIYRMNVNSGKDPLLESFDCPDPSVKTPRRGVTTTPLQALELMNNNFAQRMAAALAERVAQEKNGSLSERIQWAYQLVLNRAATDEELQQCLPLAERFGMTRVCWVLLNTSEFVYVQ
ncbi:MAG: PSD1 domain-containing protein [Planctomycetales bacterium]|nr:PSD1 domain-containing protein [Planctomycetales bacterium]